MSERVVELEVRVAYQERLIAELDEVVRAFADRVQALEREVARLRETVLHQPDPVGPPDEPPPHY